MYNTVRLEQIDNCLKLDNLIIKGLPESYVAMATVEEEESTPMVRGGPREHGDTTLSQVIGLFQNHLKVNVTACSDVAETHRLPKGRND